MSCSKPSFDSVSRFILSGPTSHSGQVEQAHQCVPCATFGMVIISVGVISHVKSCSAKEVHLGPEGQNDGEEGGLTLQAAERSELPT